MNNRLRRLESKQQANTAARVIVLHPGEVLPEGADQGACLVIRLADTVQQDELEKANPPTPPK